MPSPTLAIDPETELGPLVSSQEHDQGWKRLKVILRTGRSVTAKLTAPSAKVALELARNFLVRNMESEHLVHAVVAACRPESLPALELDSLEEPSGRKMVQCAFELTFGPDWLGKAHRLAALLSAAQSHPTRQAAAAFSQP
jgi:hypothetical protein